MCRMLAWAGAPLAAGELLSAPPHSLLVQSYRPREMTSGVVNADGWGAALWLDDGRPEPALYRSAAPIWADPNLGWMGERLRVRAAVAAVRSATPGISYELANVQPFARGALAFAHNGFVTGFRHGPQRALRQRLGKAAYEAIAGSSDSEAIFALVLDELDRGAPGLVAALRSALAVLGEVCREQDRTAVATVVLSDGVRIAGARWAQGLAPASLYAGRFPGQARAQDTGFCMASEPLDPTPGAEPRGRWREIPAGHIALAEPAAELSLESLA